MIGEKLGHCLSDDWRETLDSVARAIGGPTSKDVARLSECVRKLSDAYNDPALARATASNRDLASARLLFSFPRDVPKSASAVRELVALGMLRFDEGRPLRVLDLGAGLGASTWGLAMALESKGLTGTIEATWTEPDVSALGLAGKIVAARGLQSAQPKVRVEARLVPQGLSKLPQFAHKFDVVLMGQLLSELDVAKEPDVRRTLHANLIRRFLAEALDDRGSLVVIEPALRDRARHLHAVRDALLVGPAAPTVFAPCLHGDRCPALEKESDWCHEDMNINLPAWLVPVAKGAGLRYEGLTFAYLALRKDGRTLASFLSPGEGGEALRVISASMVTKGKREAFLCSGGAAAPGIARPSAQLRASRLNRDETPENDAWGAIARGDCVVAIPALERGRARVEASTRIVRWRPDDD